MKLLIASTLAAGLVFVASPTFAQTPSPTATPNAPGVHTNAGRSEDHAQYHQQWEECMAREGAKNKSAGKGEAEHAGQHKGTGKAATTGKESATPQATGEAKKENHHQEEMQACREQLYGRAGKEPVGAPK